MMSFMKKMIGGEEGGEAFNRLRQGLQEMTGKSSAETAAASQADKKEEPLKPPAVPLEEGAECCICLKNLAPTELGAQTCVMCSQHVCADCTSYGDRSGEGFKCCFCKKKRKDGDTEPNPAQTLPEIKVSSANSESDQAQPPPSTSEKSAAKPQNRLALQSSSNPNRAPQQTAANQAPKSQGTRQNKAPARNPSNPAPSTQTPSSNTTKPQGRTPNTTHSTNATKPQGRTPNTTHSTNATKQTSGRNNTTSSSEYSSRNKNSSSHHHQNQSSSRNSHHHPPPHHSSTSVAAASYHHSHHSSEDYHHPHHSSEDYHPQHHSSEDYHNRHHHQGTSHHYATNRNPSSSRSWTRHYEDRSSTPHRRCDPTSALSRPYDSASSLEDMAIGRRRPREVVPKRRSASCDRNTGRSTWDYPYIGTKNHLKRAILQREPQDSTYGAGGLGMRVVGGVTGPDGRLFAEITWVLPGGVADRSGLREGDKVVEWDGQRLSGLSFEEVTEVVARSRHVVELLVERESSAENFTTEEFAQDLEWEARQFPGRRLLPESPGAEIGLQLWYEPKRMELLVTAVEARSLGRSPGDLQPPRAFVQLKLLPSGATVRSHVAPASVHPEWRKTLVFPQITSDEVCESVLEVTVWDQRSWGGPLGEVRIPLQRHDLQNYLDWFPLGPPACPPRPVTPAHDMARQLLHRSRPPLFQSRSLNDDYYSPEEEQELVRYSSLNFPYYHEEYAVSNYPFSTKYRDSSLERHCRLNYLY